MSDSTERPKCGTCVHFEVRNRDEAMLAQIARPESECRPGEWVFRGERRVGCHGGPVRGACLRWQDVPLPHPTVESTFVCRLYEAGGPVIRGMAPAPGAMGSANVASFGAEKASIGGELLALGAAALLAVVGQIRRPSRWR